MASPDTPLPTYKDFCPDQPPSLDQEYAVKMFLGKTLEEAEAMFRESCLNHAEDLWAMGTVAFEYYLPAFWNYLVSEASLNDYEIGSMISVTFSCRHSEGRLGNAKALVLQCLDYAIANFDKFDIEDTPDLDFKDIAAQLSGDEETRNLFESAWVESGGDAEQLPELWQTLKNPPDDIDFQAASSGLTVLEQWKALRQSIAAM